MNVQNFRYIVFPQYNYCNDILVIPDDVLKIFTIIKLHSGLLLYYVNQMKTKVRKNMKTTLKLCAGSSERSCERK